MNPFFSRFAKDNAIVAAGQVLNFAKPLLLTPLILKSSPEAVFGAYVLVVSLGGFLAAFAPAGVDFTCKRHLPSTEEPRRRRELFYPQLLAQLGVLALCAGLLVLFERPLLGLFFRDAPPFSIWLAAAYFVCYAAYAQFGDYYRYTGRMRMYMGASVSYPYLSILFVVILRLYSGTFTVNSLLLAEILPLLGISSFLAFRIAGEIGAALPRFDWAELYGSVRLGFPLLLVSVNEYLLFSGSRYIIAAFLGVNAVAWFTAAAQLGNLPLFFPRAMGVALPPLLCKASDSGHRHEFDSMVRYAVKGHFLISVPFAAGTVFFGRELLSLFSNADVAAVAWALVPMIAAANVIYGVSLTLSKIYVVEKKTGALLHASLVSGMASAMLTLVAVWLSRSILPLGGILFMSYLAMLAIIYRGSGECVRATAGTKLLPVALISAASCAGGYLLGGISGFGFPAAVTAAAALYAAALFPAGVISRKEISFARALVAPGGRGA